MDSLTKSTRRLVAPAARISGLCVPGTGNAVRDVGRERMCSARPIRRRAITVRKAVSVGVIAVNVNLTVVRAPQMLKGWAFEREHKRDWLEPLRLVFQRATSPNSGKAKATNRRRHKQFSEAAVG